jgi:hypothetical protein
MNETLSLDAAGGLYVPPEVIKDNYLSWVQHFECFMSGGNLTLRPVVVENPGRVEMNEE